MDSTTISLLTELYRKTIFEYTNIPLPDPWPSPLLWPTGKHALAISSLVHSFTPCSLLSNKNLSKRCPSTQNLSLCHIKYHAPFRSLQMLLLLRSLCWPPSSDYNMSPRCTRSVVVPCTSLPMHSIRVDNYVFLLFSLHDHLPLYLLLTTGSLMTLANIIDWRNKWME